MVGLGFVVFFVLLALFAPWIAPHDPLATSWSAVRKAPSAHYLFGTDEIGRDVLSRVIWGRARRCSRAWCRCASRSRSACRSGSPPATSAAGWTR